MLFLPCVGRTYGVTLDPMICCNVCGAKIRWGGGRGPTRTVEWMRDMRAIYVQGRVWLNPTLSRVGAKSVKNVDLRSLPLASLPHSTHRYGNISGYVIHESCFTLLEYVCSPDTVDIGILNLMLMSFGTDPSLLIINFGHTFGGYYSSGNIHNHNLYPVNIRGVSTPNSKLDKTDPLMDESLEIAICEAQKSANSHQSLTKPEKDTVRTTRKATNECFEDLPLEILELIFFNLNSRDVLHARIASRVLAAVQLTQAFWRSRFATGNDFEYFPEPLFCKERNSPLTPAQRSLFNNPKCVHDAMRDESCAFVVGHRKRIWSIIKPLSATLRSFGLHGQYSGSVEPCGNRLASVWQEELEWEMDSLWHCGHGELLDSVDQPFHFGCRPLFKRNVLLDSRVTSVKISLLPWYETTYITGLRFQLEDGSEVPLGYILEDREVSLSVEGGLRGFELAIGERGIHALNVGMQGWRMPHARVGDSFELKIKRIGEGHEVKEVKAYFDGMKLVYLGVPTYIHKPLGPYSLWKKAEEYMELLGAKG
ncbi:hypothetical protein EJ04DRAFT_557650 [Polyplosphaeria fusca]|uniref:F-box domain-containing protein n=1 Tax=Polyplosphaeria fusca TaxID=682080 RepID=A0A9P4QLC0_9PLEO|nr:hypothetical protein EJ04DRAFT_557650 [Polyplosphaeria fusca]